MDTIRSSWWSITLNNPTDQDRQTVNGQPPRWLKMIKGQEEVGENGTHHLQMVANTEQIRASQIKAWLPRSHIEAPKSQKHKENLMNYVHKEETAVANTRFEHKYREEQQNLTMAGALTQLAELAFSREQIQEMVRAEEYGKPLYKNMDAIYEKEYWECASILIADNENLVALYTQPQYLRAWLKTRKVWVAKVEVDRQTQLSVGNAENIISPTLT